jgi:hypothetical protein
MCGHANPPPIIAMALLVGLFNAVTLYGCLYYVGNGSSVSSCFSICGDVVRTTGNGEVTFVRYKSNGQSPSKWYDETKSWFKDPEGSSKVRSIWTLLRNLGDFTEINKDEQDPSSLETFAHEAAKAAKALENAR